MNGPLVTPTAARKVHADASFNGKLALRTGVVPCYNERACRVDMRVVGDSDLSLAGYLDR